MNKQKQKEGAEKKIKALFEKAEKHAEEPDSARECIRKARGIAMHFNIKLPKEMRKKFCRKCCSFFTPLNRKIRVKHGFLVLKCLSCGCISKYKCS
jgi:ribonuclease P protein subunit RPR2